MSGEIVKEAGTAWAQWPQRSPSQSFTLGVEEEIMLLSPGGWALAQAADEVLPRIGEGCRANVCPETHAAALEIETDVHHTVAGAAQQLGELRGAVRDAAAAVDLGVGSSGVHPFAVWRETAMGVGDRQDELYGSMRELARREPTYALHVHVGLPDPDAAMAVFNRMRVHLPLLLALSGNSPFWQGRDTGLASARTPLFQAFPRVGIPRRFESYDEWVAAVDLLVSCESFPDASYLWWDVRLAPRLGTIEIRIMDAQIDTESTASLVAFVQALARMELEEAWAEEASHAPQEVWEENRFVAARDGTDAHLIVATESIRVPVRDRVDELMNHLRPHAQDLGCADELEGICRLVHENGADRQRAAATGDDRLPGLVSHLADAF